MGLDRLKWKANIACDQKKNDYLQITWIVFPETFSNSISKVHFYSDEKQVARLRS